ncbi:MAG: PhoH family protein [Candidatus Omnitrophica bacterium]|nr:PhoH family protein [Candidatus Omnitrophota bacterium]
MERTLKLNNIREAQELFGRQDKNLKIIEHELNAVISARDDTVKIKGSKKNVDKACSVIEGLLALVREGRGLDKEDIHFLLRSFKNPSARRKTAHLSPVEIGASLKGRVIGPKTEGQREYVEAIRRYDLVFGMGPAGTGKTYLAMTMAVDSFKKGEVNRIILTRPALEAGEKLGFLPGDMVEKISPYLRPLYDALYDMMDAEKIEKYIETGTIEVAPLAYMRGRTLNDAFIILDEAQNCTVEQLKMFLTRLGFDSKAVITADPTQSDLPGGKPIGLLKAQEILKDIEDIKFIYFSGADVVRHELVQKIIEAYEKAGAKE